jgi:pimeloyl-ACP methyl ester carboxylesterase
MTALIEPILGRYARLAVEGVQHRIYFEEAGVGPAVLLLHTAGADTRQWRFVLNDERLAARRRFVAFDMPWHGKSLPPENFETSEYLLTTETYMKTVLAFCDALGLERPVLAGCSMGGRIALQLAALHADRFSGFIAIEASDFQPAWYDIDWFHRPDAHGGEMGAALVSANIAPQAPAAERWNTLWMFMQSGPGVFRGDLSFYTRDDSLVGRLSRIDTRKTPVHLLCGEYDLTCTPADAERTAKAIAGATLAVMENLGHFPMSENPKAFRPYFAEALERMRG